MTDLSIPHNRPAARAQVDGVSRNHHKVFKRIREAVEAYHVEGEAGRVRAVPAYL